MFIRLPITRPCRGRRIGLLVLLLLVTTACGHNQMLFEVDLLSYITNQPPEQHHYLVPAATVLPEPITIEPQTVVLADGLSNVVDIGSVQLTMEIIFDNRDGAGTAELHLFLTGAGPDAPYVYDSRPIRTQVIALQPATSTSVRLEISSQQAPTLIDSFASGSVAIGLALFIDALGSSEDLTGNWVISQFTALVTGTGELVP